jgi:hypothetical protein
MSAFHYLNRNPIVNHKRQKVGEDLFDPAQAFYYAQNNISYDSFASKNKVKLKIIIACFNITLNRECQD